MKITAFFTITFFWAAFLMTGFLANAQTNSCGEQNQVVHAACKTIEFKSLPKPVKEAMKKLRCDVKTGSNYDYGFAIDLNNDGVKEYAFCCMEAMHGPCDMRIFAKVAGKWKPVIDFLNGYQMGGNNPGFTVLMTKHDGYFDICQDGQTRIFKNGMYK